MNEHTVKSFDEELLLLDRRSRRWAAWPSASWRRPSTALEQRDPKLAKAWSPSDRAIDQLEARAAGADHPA